VCNFAAETAGVPAGDAAEVVLATDESTRLQGGLVHLPARSGALLR
jgi:hypothetical protein